MTSKTATTFKTPKIILPIILASSSPRRSQLLQDIRLPIQVITPQVDETPKRGEQARALVKRLAHLKAAAVKQSGICGSESRLILAADTMVAESKAGPMLGKPKSAREATAFLGRLSGKKHFVFTGYCLMQVANGQVLRVVERVVVTQVEMLPLTPATIRAYVGSQEPMDKAGAYGAQGLGMSLIHRIIGSYQNVVGLPVAAVLCDLESIFQVKRFSWLKSGAPPSRP